MLNEKATIVLLTVGLIEKTSYKWVNISRTVIFNSSGAWVKVEIDWSNYVTKTDLKNATGLDTSKFAKKIGLASSKPNEDKLNIDKLKNMPSNFCYVKSKVDKSMLINWYLFLITIMINISLL